MHPPNQREESRKEKMGWERKERESDRCVAREEPCS